jgi:hypothetical protein
MQSKFEPHADLIRRFHLLSRGYNPNHSHHVITIYGWKPSYTYAAISTVLNNNTATCLEGMSRRSKNIYAQMS